MTAGKGIVHSEFPEQEEGLMWGFQLWVNLPAKNKLTKPRYQDIQGDGIPEVVLGPGAKARVLVGGVEARGFILAAPVALALGAGFVPVRKAGKLPGDTHAVGYELEYGEATLELHQDSIAPGERVLMVDDVLATGGTVAATAELIEACGGVVHGAAVLMELSFLPGRETLGDVPLSLIRTV
jgi:adenine phosphoribosyltransferase